MRAWAWGPWAWGRIWGQGRNYLPWRSPHSEATAWPLPCTAPTRHAVQGPCWLHLGRDIEDLQACEQGAQASGASPHRGPCLLSHSPSAPLTPQYGLPPGRGAFSHRRPSLGASPGRLVPGTTDTGGQAGASAQPRGRDADTMVLVSASGTEDVFAVYGLSASGFLLNPKGSESLAL